MEETATHKVTAVPEDLIPYLQTEQLWGEELDDDSSITKNEEGNITHLTKHRVGLLMVQPVAVNPLAAIFGGGVPRKYLVIVSKTKHYPCDCGSPACNRAEQKTDFLSSYLYEDLVEATSDADEALKRVKKSLGISIS